MSSPPQYAHSLPTPVLDRLQSSVVSGDCQAGFSEYEELYASRDGQADARDVRGEVGAEEGDGVRDLLRLAGAPHRGPFDHPLVHLGVPQAESLGPDHAGNDRVAGDPVPAALERERARESEDPRLRRRVGRDRKSTRLNSSHITISY